jgi:tripartite-type tricarboxylate transporter receptor subunit TctC
MILERRQFLHLAAGAAALPATARIARAQAYPSRAVKVIVGFPASGGIDLNARLIAQWLSDRLGQPFNVENRPGPGTNAATEAVVHAPADGYTLLLASAANAISTSLFQSLNFNFIRDITPIAGIARAPLVMVVSPSSTAKTVAEFIAYARANPGKLAIGSTFVGAPPFMAAALFKVMAGIDVSQTSYPSDAAAITDLLSGKVQAHFAGSGAVTEDIKSGKLRALAVTTITRLEFLPDIPAMADSVPSYEASTWIGLGAPRNTPTEIVKKLNNEINVGLTNTKVKSRLAELGYVPMPMTSAEFERFITNETEKWAKVVKLAGIKPQ